MKKQEKQKKKRESDILWNKKKGLRNYETNVISFLFMELFLAMAFYLVYFPVYKSDSVVNNSYNTRIDILSDQVVRGCILTSACIFIVETKTDDTGE